MAERWGSPGTGSSGPAAVVEGDDTAAPLLIRCILGLMLYMFIFN